MLLQGRTETSITLDVSLLDKVLEKLKGNDIKILLKILTLLTVNCEVIPVDVNQLSIELELTNSTILASIKKLQKLNILVISYLSPDVLGLRLRVENDVEPKKTKNTVETKYSPKKILSFFLQKYEETYGAKYNVNYGRDYNHIKTLILLNSNNSEEYLLTVIDKAFMLYDIKWRSTSYPRLTLGSLSSFVYQKVIEEENNKSIRNIVLQTNKNKEYNHSELF